MSNSRKNELLYHSTEGQHHVTVSEIWSVFDLVFNNSFWLENKRLVPLSLSLFDKASRPITGESVNRAWKILPFKSILYTLKGLCELESFDNVFSVKSNKDKNFWTENFMDSYLGCLLLAYQFSAQPDHFSKISISWLYTLLTAFASYWKHEGPNFKNRLLIYS